MQTVTLNVSDEVKALADAIGGLVASVKSGGSVIQDAQALLTPLISAATTIQNVGTDIKLPANQAYLAYALALALEPQPVAAAAVKKS